MYGNLSFFHKSGILRPMKRTHLLGKNNLKAIILEQTINPKRFQNLKACLTPNHQVSMSYSTCKAKTLVYDVLTFLLFQFLFYKCNKSTLNSSFSGQVLQAKPLLKYGFISLFGLIVTFRLIVPGTQLELFIFLPLFFITFKLRCFYIVLWLCDLDTLVQRKCTPFFSVRLWLRGNLNELSVRILVILSWIAIVVNLHDKDVFSLRLVWSCSHLWVKVKIVTCFLLKKPSTLVKSIAAGIFFEGWRPAISRWPVFIRSSPSLVH